MSGELDEKGLEAAKNAVRLNPTDIETAIRAYLAASPSPSEMTPEEIRLENLKQMAGYADPIVSFDVREPYYLASCDKCGWIGSTELCGTDSFGDDSDVYCPRCHSSGADCGKVAEKIETLSSQVQRLAEENEALRKEKDEAIDRSKVWEYNWSQEVKVKAEVVGWCKNYQARIKALEEALRPFAAEAEELATGLPDNAIYALPDFPDLGITDFTVGHLRSARSTLKENAL